MSGPRPLRFPICIAARLSHADHAKLQLLSTAAERTPGEVLRLLVRWAEPTHLPQVCFPLTSDVPGPRGTNNDARPTDSNAPA